MSPANSLAPSTHAVPRPVVLVTGAARRVGRVIALELAAAGWDVAVHHRDSADEARQTCADLAAAGARALAFVVDLAEAAAVRALVPRVVAAFGRLDALVNNASLFAHDDAASFSADAAGQHYQVNAVAPVLLAQALHAHVQARDARGCVVNLLDQKLWNPNPDYLSYTLSKAALREATTLLAQALAPSVRVVGVAPGVTLPSGPMSAAEFAAAHGLTPLGRSSTPQDVAEAVRYVLAAQAITGTTLLVDGGQHLAAQARDVLYLARAQAG
ncbi:MAG: SDR family oxidoreductase [Burkholderiales bacterium]|nr:SDR family oxidoreductase [Burkholderiales bacterium]